MKTDRDLQFAADPSVAPSGRVDSDAGSSERQLLDGYLRDVLPIDRMQPEEETRHAKDLRDSRKALCAILSELPERFRSRVLGSNGAPTVDSRKWTREQLDGAYERLLLLGRETPSTILSNAIADARRYKSRLDRARDTMILSNLRLVVRVAGRFKNRGIPLPDLIQEGNLGLIRAVEKFEVDRGYRFSTYAVWWIRHGLSKAFSESLRLVRLPANVGMKVRQLRKHVHDLERDLGRAPTMEEIASEAGLPSSQVTELLAVSRTPHSLDDPAPNDPNSIRSNLLVDTGRRSPLEYLDARDRRDGLMRLMDRLSERERTIVKLRLGIECDAPRTLATIAEMLHVSRERVRQIELRALSKLRHAHSILDRPPILGLSSVARTSCRSRPFSRPAENGRIAPLWGSTN